MYEQLIPSQSSKKVENNEIKGNNRVNEIVRVMLQTHIGGKEFFENLDLAIRDKDIVQSLYQMIEEFCGLNQIYFIVTGKFGIFFRNWIECFGADNDFVYSVNGGLREGTPIDSLEIFKEDLNQQEFIIIDDSYYSGRTVQVIKEHVESLGGIYKGTFVVYDGSKEINKDIHYLYRYYESKQLNS